MPRLLIKPEQFLFELRDGDIGEPVSLHAIRIAREMITQKIKPPVDPADEGLVWML